MEQDLAGIAGNEGIKCILCLILEIISGKYDILRTDSIGNCLCRYRYNFFLTKRSGG